MYCCTPPRMCVRGKIRRSTCTSVTFVTSWFKAIPSMWILLQCQSCALVQFNSLCSLCAAVERGKVSDGDCNLLTAMRNDGNPSCCPYHRGSQHRLKSNTGRTLKVRLRKEPKNLIRSVPHSRMVHSGIACQKRVPHRKQGGTKCQENNPRCREERPSQKLQTKLGRLLR